MAILIKESANSLSQDQVLEMLIVYKADIIKVVVINNDWFVSFNKTNPFLNYLQTNNNTITYDWVSFWDVEYCKEIPLTETPLNEPLTIKLFTNQLISKGLFPSKLLRIEEGYIEDIEWSKGLPFETWPVEIYLLSEAFNKMKHYVKPII